MTATPNRPVRLGRPGSIRQVAGWQLRVRSVTVPCPACGARIARTARTAPCFRCGKDLLPN